MLKHAIKEGKKPAFDHITADSLDIWKVSIPVDGDTNLNAQVEDLFETKPLSPVEQLSDVFRDVVKRYLHVIVRGPTGECSPEFSLSPSNNAFFAGDNELERKVGELVGNIRNVTLYVKTLNKWTAQDLHLPKNHVSLRFDYGSRQPRLSSLSSVAIPSHLQSLLDGLGKKRQLPKGDKVMLYVFQHIDHYSNAVRRSNMLF
jgi:hypothetical protein